MDPPEICNRMCSPLEVSCTKPWESRKLVRVPTIIVIQISRLMRSRVSAGPVVGGLSLGKTDLTKNLFLLSNLNIQGL